jgi:ribonuclease HI
MNNSKNQEEQEVEDQISRENTPPLQIDISLSQIEINEETRDNRKCTQLPNFKQWKDIKESSKSKYIGFFDGSGRWNPQAAGGGWALYYNQEEINAGAIHLPYCTSNDGESAACAALLCHINKIGLPNANIFGDSKMIVDHMANRKLIGRHEWADRLIPFQFEKWRKSITFNHIPRSQNKRADAIANAAAISLEAGKKVAEEQDQTQREIGEKPVELPMRCRKLNEFIENPKKMTVAFPIDEDFKIPIIGTGESEIGIIEDFRETRYTEFKSISIPKIDKYFTKEKN